MRKAALLISLSAVLIFAPSALACWSDGTDLSWRNDLNADFNDFGMLFMDSHPNNNCGPTAATRLTWKLQAIPDSGFHQWLSGGNVSLAFAAALQLGPRGLITPELDAQLARAGKNFWFVPDPTNCGFDNGKWARGNTCMEDHLVAAAGYAW